MTVNVPVNVPLANEGIKITFCATCAFCGVKTDGAVDGDRLALPFYTTVKLKPGWETVQTDNGLNIWCGDCEIARA